MADVEALLRTIEELRGSRARLVQSAQRDRLRLERELHDGAQQRLFAIQIKLEAARERVAGDEELARGLEEVAADVAAAVDELRVLAQGLYPAALGERGLVVALRTIPYESAIPVEVVDKGSPRCAPAVEEAVYFTALEAIRKAEPGACVTVTLEPSADGLAFAVTAGRPSFDLERDADTITSMRDRIDAVGGELQIASATVRGRVPSGGRG
jgi:signal transduction histidine kinase